MFYVITPNQLILGKTIKEVNKQLNSNLELIDFHSKGKDFVVNLNNDDIEFVQDTKKMSRIMVQNLFKKSDSGVWLLYLIVGMQFILLLKGWYLWLSG